MNSRDTVMICFMQYSCKCNNMAVACPQEVICDLLISFLKLYFGQIAAVSCKPDYLTSRLATFFFHNTAASASISNIYSKDTWRQSMNLEFIMIGQLVIVKVTLPICIIQRSGYSYWNSTPSLVCYSYCSGNISCNCRRNIRLFRFI